jgi:NitT/TauT family transport system substrate-binding protein
MTHRTSRGLVLLVALVSLLTACGGGGSEGGSGAGGSAGTPAAAGAPEKASLTVGVLAIADLAPFYLAIQDGLFQEEGLTVTPVVATGGAAQLAGMVAGDVDIAFSNYTSVLQAASKGLPVQIIRENNRGGPQGIYASAASGITEPADLAGKTIAINSLGNVQELTARAVLDSHGVDPDSVQFLELPPADQPAGLATGKVDAAWLIEPFLTQVERAGSGTRIVSAFEGPTADMPVAGWTATQQFVKQDPNSVAAFVRAMDKAMKLATDQPEKIAQVLPTYTKISPELAAQLSKPGLSVTSDLSDLDVSAKLMVKYGIIEKVPDLDEMVIDADELPQQ